MADRTNDERLREITVIAARERARVEEIKRLRAELLAARARIAKLEQEPPMALVDFGVGVNWKGLHEDMQRLRAERDAARAEVAAAREHMGVVQSALDAAHLEEVEDELGGLRAEIRRLDGVIDDIEERAGRALGEPEGTHETTNVQRLCAEVERLRDMLSRLCIAVQHSAPGYGVYEDWGDICDGDLLALRERMIEAKALLAKHKETNQ